MRWMLSTSSDDEPERGSDSRRYGNFKVARRGRLFMLDGKPRVWQEQSIAYFIYSLLLAQSVRLSTGQFLYYGNRATTESVAPVPTLLYVMISTRAYIHHLLMENSIIATRRDISLFHVELGRRNVVHCGAG